MTMERKLSFEKGAPDRLIGRVMTADIFADHSWLTVPIENAGGMNSAGARKPALEFSQKRRQRKQSGNVDPDIFCRSNRWKILLNGGDALLAADAAAARNCSEPFR